MTKMISKCDLLRVPLVLVCVGLCFGCGGRDSLAGDSAREEGTAGAAESDVQNPVPSAETAAGKKDRTALAALRKEIKRPAVTPYRVIFNCDGSGVFSSAKGSVDAYIQNVFGPLEDSHVDALFWNDGAGGNTASYDSEVLELTGARIGKVDPDLLRWIKEGNDPPKVVVREAKKRGLDIFYSFRINDIHDAFTPVEFPTFKVEHPEWMMGAAKFVDGQGLKVSIRDEVYFPELATALNFAVPEVRELKLRTIEAIFHKYDFDGIELDLMRFPRFFRAFLEYRNAVILTDFLRTVRQRLNEQSRQRGRPIKLAVRVDENLVACRLDGFDVGTWIDEGLIDILVVGDYAFPGDDDIQAFKDLAHGKPVQVYVCVARPHKIIGGVNKVLRGLAANYWEQRADGMYTFNWVAYQIPLLKEIGDPQLLVTKDKIFPADCSEYGPDAQFGHPSSPRFHNWMFVSLPVTLHEVWNANSFTVISVDVADDLGGPSAEKVKSLRLWVQLENLVSGDVVDFRLNGHALARMPDPEEGSLLQFTLRPDQLKVGRNEVGLRLNKRGAKAENDIIVAAVEIHVDYE